MIADKADKIDKTVEAAELQWQQYLGLLEISKAIASQREIRGLFRELAERLHPFIDFQYLRVMVHDKTRNVMKMKIFEGSEPETGQFPSEQAVDGSIAGWVWQNQQPFITGDVQHETRFTTTKQLSDLPVKSVCVLPLTTARERLGVLVFASERSGAYEQIDLEFALMVAGQIAVAVEAQFYQYKLARERDRLELLLDVNNILVTNLDLRELLSALSIGVRKVVSHDLAALALYDPAINMLRISALDFPANEDLFKEGEILPIEGEHGAGLAFKSRQVVIVNKKESSTDSQVCNRFVSAGVKSCCIVPVVSHDRTLGILSVGSLHENAFSESDAELLSQIAKQVAIAVENALSFRKIEALKNKLEEEKLYLEEEIRDERYFEEIIGNSSALRRVLQEVETVAPADSTVLIVGETGTGKELIARAIHNLSARHDRTLVKVNCAAIPTGLLESELFGHERGAFTGATERRVGRFELAHQGTIFLDEVGDIPLELQPKLLRVLQEQEFERLGSSRTIHVDARVVAATNVNLARLVEEKKFRSDLFYRLNVFPITLPPLRERPEDIPMLVHYFANKYAQQMRKPIERIPVETMATLAAYRWPGNIRELQNLIERAVILTRGRVLEVPLGELKQQANVKIDQLDGAATLETVERAHILRVLRESNWVIGGPKGAAARLGMQRTTLNTRIRKLGITRPRPEQF